MHKSKSLSGEHGTVLYYETQTEKKNSHLLPLILLISHYKWTLNAILKRKILDTEDARLHTQISPAFLCSTNPAAIRQFHNPKQIKVQRNPPMTTRLGDFQLHGTLGTHLESTVARFHSRAQLDCSEEVQRILLAGVCYSCGDLVTSCSDF